MGAKLKAIFPLLLLLTCLNAHAQDELVRPGLIRAQATISVGDMLNSTDAYYYLHGNLEGYLNRNYSVSGEGYLFRGSSNVDPALRYNHSLFFGFSRHFVKNNFDYYIGIQPGLSFVTVNSPVDEFQNSMRIASNPVFSTVTGFNYYIWKYFHFFAQVRFVAGQHNTNVHAALNELKFSFGLGFNVNTLKVK